MGDTKVLAEPSIKRKKKGQGLTEYAAILAFVAILVAITFGFSKGSLFPGVSAAFSAIASAVNAMSTAAGDAV